jgi:hypothetical protein
VINLRLTERHRHHLNRPSQRTEEMGVTLAMTRISQTIINKAFRALKASRHITSPVRRWPITTSSKALFQAKVNITAKDSILKGKTLTLSTLKANTSKINITKDISGQDMSQVGLQITQVLVSGKAWQSAPLVAAVWIVYCVDLFRKRYDVRLTALVDFFLSSLLTPSIYAIHLADVW